RDHLDQYYWFCLEHVRDYNRQWDYFAGMSSADIESHLRQATVWERPTWPLGAKARERDQNIRDQVFNEFFGEGPETAQPSPNPSVTKAE
ncbi:hypothetical protein ACSLVQ_28490, partial [Klebsiella pneumoniae]|uniref:hypothetical protein n=1 Tax=Klebsiella pneumoniae TaxID=573 RepID=UPI003EE3B6B9